LQINVLSICSKVARDVYVRGKTQTVA